MVASKPVLNNFSRTQVTVLAQHSQTFTARSIVEISVPWICYTTNWKWPTAPSWRHDAACIGPICTRNLFQSKALAIQVTCLFAQKRPLTPWAWNYGATVV